MNFAEAERKLRGCGQEHLLAGWSKLPKKGRTSLLAQIGLKGSDPSVYALLYMLDFGAADVVDYAAS